VSRSRPSASDAIRAMGPPSASATHVGVSGGIDERSMTKDWEVRTNRTSTPR